jgi:hypothetical protein
MKLAVVRSERSNSCTAPRTSTLSPYDLPRLAINKLSVVTEDGQTRHFDVSEEHRPSTDEPATNHSGSRRGGLYWAAMALTELQGKWGRRDVGTVMVKYVYAVGLEPAVRGL